MIRLGSGGPLPAWRRNQAAVTATAALLFFGGTLVTPFLPLYVHDLAGGGPRGDLLGGIALSSTPLLAALLGPTWGRFADRYGIRKSCQRALAAIVVHWLLLAVLTDLWAVLAARAVLGLLSGFSVLSVAMATAGAPRDRIQGIVGTLQTAQIVAAAVAPVLGGLLFDAWGFRATCLLTAGCAAACLVLVTTTYRDLPPADPDPAEAEPDNPGGRGLDRSVLGWTAFLFAANLALRSLSFLTPRGAASFAADAGEVGVVAGRTVAAGAIGEAFGAGLAGRFGAPARPGGAVRACLLGSAASAACLALSGGPGSFTLARGLLGLAAGGLATLAFAAAAVGLPARGRSAVLGTLSAASLLGGALGPLLASGVTAASGLGAALWLPAALFAGLAAAAARAGRRTPGGGVLAQPSAPAREPEP